ncbi:MAG: hypothetical protein PWP65_969 [Clostridia bacterium]|nr:hypothetical protein [Clostridia bacterium]
MFKKIILAFDGSPHARRALDAAVDLAQKYGAKLYIVSVVNIPDFAGTVDEVNGALEKGKEFFNKQLEEAQKTASREGVEVETRILAGHPFEAIARFVDSEGCDLIVVGSRGLGTVKRYLLGSVSEAIVRYAQCPVLVVKSRDRR